jgi:hypothetical protein
MTISILSFSPGTTIRSADVNSDYTAITNALSGATANNFLFVSTANTTVPLTTQLPSAPASDQDVVITQVTGDAAARAGCYIRGSDGYGGYRGGVGSSITAHLYAQSFGWQITESLHITGSILTDGGQIGSNGTGGLTVAGFTCTGAATIRQIAASFASGSFYDGSAQFSGTGSGTYTHGLSVAPTFVGVTQKVASATTTVGSDTYGSTSIHININGAFLFTAWVVLN